MNYLTAKQIKNIYSITSQTLHNWRLKNKIKFKRLPSGKIVYESLEPVKEKTKKHVGYARVSNTKQKDNLIRQESIIRQFMSSSGIIVDKVFTDIASGMNENRPSFNNLIKQCFEGNIEKIYVTYKDRLTRFGFGYIESFLKQFDVEIIVINATKEEDFQQELTQDLISIIHHFSMKLYSNRRKIFKELEKEIKKDINTL